MTKTRIMSDEICETPSIYKSFLKNLWHMKRKVKKMY